MGDHKHTEPGRLVIRGKVVYSAIYGIIWLLADRRMYTRMDAWTVADVDQSYVWIYTAHR